MVEPDPPESAEEIGAGLSNWEFWREPPTTVDVIELMKSLPDIWGQSYSDYVDYVQALPARKKIQVPHPTNPNLMVDERVDVWSIYMSVAGRVRMLNEAAYQNGWKVDFTPERVTPTGMPGYLSWEPRLVYREYVSIWDERRGDGMLMKELGSKPGTAWVPYTGGSQAAGSNPFEKVETSARGRAIAAWGFGVLPGSGIASVEEMANLAGNQAALDAESGGRRGRSGPRAPSRSTEEMLAEVLTLMERVRQERGQSAEEMTARTAKYLTSIGAGDVVDPAGEIVFGMVKPGHLTLLANSLKDTLERIRSEQDPV